MTKNVPTRLRYEESNHMLRGDPENWAVAQTARWSDTHADMDGAVDYPATMRRLTACYNACAGIPAEVLERLSIQGFASVVHDSLRQGEALSTVAQEALESLRGAAAET